jgi:hypothetical protein
MELKETIAALESLRYPFPDKVSEGAGTVVVDVKQ